MTSEDTVDTIWSEKIRIRQPKKGYRFGIDSVLLAHFIQLSSQEEALEIGCGTGVVLLLLAHLQEFKRLVGVELQHQLATYAKSNLELNQVSDAEVIEADANFLHEILSPRSFDFIFSNPPYRKVGKGRLNPFHQKAVARHELKMTLQDLFVCAERFLKPEGRLTVILPEFREKDFLELVMRYGYFWREKRYVHSFAEQPCAFFLATVGKTSGPLRIQDRLVIYDSPGCYTTEVSLLLREPG